MTETQSYTDWQYWRSCARKRPYDSLAQASRAVVAVRHRWDERVIPYQCKFCALWHLTGVKKAPR